MKNYEMFSGKDLEIADLIQRRRLQLLVHSCLYYNMNTNLIDDKTWDTWARELVDLQKLYPELSNKVSWSEAFQDWDASTGAFLPLNDPWVVNTATVLLRICGRSAGKKLACVNVELKNQPKQQVGQISLF